MSEVRTLILDDSSVMRKIVQRALRQAGMDSLVVFEATNGGEGIEVLRSKHVDLILPDINMPSMDGLEFLRQIRAQHLVLGVPVVMVESRTGAVALAFRWLLDEAFAAPPQSGLA